MEITLNRQAHQLYEGTNKAGQSINLGGGGQAVGPMEAVLMAGAACASIDLEIILQKMQQGLTALNIQVKGDRAEDEVPKVFKKVHLHFQLWGELEASKVEKAIALSVEKYCSVLTMVAKTAEVSFDYEIIN
jgi:putative redox protein